jgi:OOP family OmpA-OmpF porin
MKKTTMSLALSAALLAMAGSAVASEFDGAYVGLKAGGSRSAGTGDQKASASALGVEGGYGWDAGKALLGIYGFLNFNDSTTHSPSGLDYGSDIYGLGLKAGLPIGNLLPYAKLGYAEAKGRKDASGVRGDGVIGALGVEYKLSTNWSVSGEYSYTNPSVNIADTKFKNENFMLGLNYYFKAPPPAPVVAEAPAPEPVAEVAPPPEPRWKSIVTEKPISIDGANFAFDSAKLLPGADERLNQVLQAANDYPEISLQVDGHTDSTGARAYNQGLSERRAASVKQWLVDHGVSADRISTAGYADTKPIADNSTRQGRAANRRVEVFYTIREESKVRVQ